MTGLDGILASFELTPGPEGHFVAPNVPGDTGMIFGGQLIGQTIVAASVGMADKTVKTVHTVFARAGRPDTGVEIAVEPIHSGRTVAASNVRIHQGARTCTSSTVLLTAPEPDFIHHADPIGDLPGPDACTPVNHLSGWDLRIVDDVDLNDPDATGPPDVAVWSRFPDAPRGAGLDEALLAYATDGFLIGTAMRPHPGVGQSQAHRTIATGVLSHTITFHEPFSAGDWLLLDQHSSHAGGGRSYGRGSVFTAQGRLVASFVQDAMIRPVPNPG